MDSTVNQIVARVLESRRAGRRLSVDEAMATIDGVSDRAAARRSAIQALASRSGAPGTPGTPGSPGAAGTPDARAEVEEPPLPEIEGYDIIDVLGRGGMGVVYEAYQGSTGRRVALKVMRDSATATESARRRFEREVELAARLQHPSIVAIIDSGALRGSYYYVMEFVEGGSLDVVLRPGECDPRAALEVMIQVAEAVDYAHQRGVLHRDLKPSNVLVDDKMTPRLLDFGLAKAIEPGDVGTRCTLSEPGQLLGTLAFMPPEQSRADHAQMSVRSDVYALSAIAYDLLTGHLPCDVDCPLAEALRRIAAVDPPRPSSRRKGLGADVDAILLKGLEKDPARRYATAGEFAADIRRSLNHEPITARRTGPITRVARWARRNRAVATVGSLAIATIVVIGAVSFIQIAQQRNRAESERDSAQNALSSILTTINTIDPDDPRPRIVQKRVLSNASDSIARLESKPEFLTKARTALGLAYRNLGEYEEAERQFHAVLDLERTLDGEGSAAFAASLHNLASALFWQGRYKEAETQYRAAEAIRRSLYARGDAATGVELARTLDHMSATLGKEKRIDEAVAVWQEGVDLRRKLLGPRHLDVAQSLNNLATIYNEAGQFEKAPPLCEQALSIIHERLGTRNRGAVAVAHNLAWACYGLGRFSDADALLTDTVATKLDIWGPDHVLIASSELLLAKVRLELGDLDSAQQLCADALRIDRVRLGEDNQETTDCASLLATITARRAEIASRASSPR